MIKSGQLGGAGISVPFMNQIVQVSSTEESFILAEEYEFLRAGILDDDVVKYPLATTTPAITSDAALAGTPGSIESIHDNRQGVFINPDAVGTENWIYAIGGTEWVVRDTTLTTTVTNVTNTFRGTGVVLLNGFIYVPDDLDASTELKKYSISGNTITYIETITLSELIYTIGGFTTDGTHLIGFSAEGAEYKIDTDGNVLSVTVDVINDPRVFCAEWTPFGYVYFSYTTGRLKATRGLGNGVYLLANVQADATALIGTEQSSTPVGMAYDPVGNALYVQSIRNTSVISSLIKYTLVPAVGVGAVPDTAALEIAPFYVRIK